MRTVTILTLSNAKWKGFLSNRLKKGRERMNNMAERVRGKIRSLR